MWEVAMYPEWVEKQCREGCMIKRRGSKYYLYETRIFYDNVDHIPIEVAGTCLGQITQDGIIPAKNKTKLNTLSARHEYRASHLIDILCQDILYSLKAYFHDDALMIYVLAKEVLIHQASLDDMFSIYRKSYDYITYPRLDFSSSSIEDLLQRLSYDRLSSYRFMRTYMKDDNYFIFLDKYNLNNTMLDVLYCFHHQSLAYFRLCHKDTSIDDIITNGLKEIPYDVILIGNDTYPIPYIMPCYKNITINHDHYFIYHDKSIYYAMLSLDNDKLYIYDDSNIMIKDGVKLLLTLRTNTLEEPLELYKIYMDKKMADDLIDVFHDILNKNVSYLHDKQHAGMLFINYLSFMMYQRIDNKCKSYISGYEVIQNLKLISKQMINNQWIINNDNEEFLEDIKEIIPEYFL